MQPLVSIIIPTYNRAHLIGETLESVLAQTHQNWECIVVDDGSTDTTGELMKFYCEKDDRIQFYNRPASKKKGASSCRNYGLEKAKGDYIQFLDSDDLLKSTKFTEQLSLFTNNSSSTLVTCRWGSFLNFQNLRIKYKYHSYKNFKKSTGLIRTFGKYNEYFPLHVYLTPKSLIEKAGFWNENLTHNDDGEFFTRVILNAAQIKFTEKTEVYYRAGANERLSILNNEKKIESAIESWKIINEIMQIKFPQNKNYVLNGKRNIYNQIKINYPEIINKNQVFFSGLFSRRYQFQQFGSKCKQNFSTFKICLEQRIVKLIKAPL